MKKLILLITILLCATSILAGCGDKKSSGSDSAASEETQMTAEEVVRQYFAYWQNRDQDSMDRLVIEDQQLEEDDPDVSLVTSLTLNSCMQVADELKDEWDAELYPDPYDFAYVDVDFDIAFEGGEGAGYIDGNYQTRFYLVKESEDAGWKIVMWGLG